MGVKKLESDTKEDCRFRLFVNGVLRRICGHKKDDVTGGGGENA